LTVLRLELFVDLERRQRCGCLRQNRHRRGNSDVELLRAGDGWLCWPDNPNGCRFVVRLVELNDELVVVDGAAGKFDRLHLGFTLY
jgi:hypothetical protein